MLEFFRSKTQGLLAWLLVGAIIAAFALVGVQQYFRGGHEANVATVNGQGISQQRLQQAYQAQLQRLQQMFGANFNADLFPEDKMKEQILEDMIRQELIVQAATDSGLRLSDEQLDSMIREVPQFQRNGRYSQELFEQAVRSQGQTPAAFREQARRQILSQQLQIAVMGSEFATVSEERALKQLRAQTRDIGFMVLSAAKYEKDVSVTDDEISHYYEENAAQYAIPEQVSINYIDLSVQKLAEGIPVSEQEIAERYESQKANYHTPEERKARHILIRVAKDADEKTVAQAKKKIEELAKRLAKGESFAELAKNNSQDPGSAAKGGELGYFGRGIMDPAFEAAAFALKKGEISQPVRSSFGFHLIQVEDMRGGVTKPLSEVRNQIAEEIRLDMAGDKYYKLAGELGNLALEHPDSLEEASNQLGVPLQQSAPFARHGGAGIASNPKIVTAAFSDAVLKDGNNSGVIELGEKHVVVLRLREHFPEKKRTLDEVKPQIVAQLKKGKAKVHAEEMADSLLARLAKGEEPKVLAKEAGAEWHNVQNVAREGSQVPPAVVTQAFRMPRPGDSSLTAAKTTTHSGDPALIALYKVTVPAETADSENAALKHQLQQSDGQAMMNAMLASLRAKASIKR